MANTVFGVLRVNSQPIDGATAYLFPSSVFGGVMPAQNTPLPASGWIATCVTGPANGGSGAFLYQQVPQQEYIIGMAYLGATAYDYYNASAVTVGASGQLILNSPGSFKGTQFAVQQAGGDLFAIYTDPSVVPVSGNLIETSAGTSDAQYKLVNRHSQVPVSGFLTGMLNILHPGNCTALNLTAAPGSVAPNGRVEIRLNDQWALFANGAEADFARGWCGFHDYNMPSLSGSVLGSDGAWLDSDHQFHIAGFDTATTGGGELLYLEHHTLVRPVPNNLSTSIRFGNPNTNGTVFEAALVQAQTSFNTPNLEYSSLNLYRRECGILLKALAIREFGEVAILQGGSGYLTVPNDPAGTANYGLLNAGGGGFTGGGATFNGFPNGTGLALNLTANSLADFCNFQLGGGAPIFRMDPIGQTYLTQTGTQTNVAVHPLHLKHRPTGTPAAGIGTGIEFLTFNAVSAEVTAGQLQVILDAANSGTEKSFFNFRTLNTGVMADAFRIHHTLDLQGYGAAYWNQAPDANASRGLINIGDGSFASKDGAAGTAGTGVFAGSALGTYLALNAGPAFGGDLTTMQVSGATRFKVTAAGKALALAGLGAGNSVAKTTLTSPGTVTKMLEVFDAAGTSLGAVPIYSLGSFS